MQEKEKMDVRLAHSLMARNASLNTSTFGTKCKIKSVTLEPAWGCQKQKESRSALNLLPPCASGAQREGGKGTDRSDSSGLRRPSLSICCRPKGPNHPAPSKSHNPSLERVRTSICKCEIVERTGKGGGGGTYSRSHHSRKEEIKVDPCHLGPDERDVGFRYRLILIQNTKVTSRRLQRRFPKAEEEEEEEEEGGGRQTESKSRTHRNLVDLGKGLEHIQKQAKEVFSAYMLGHDAQQINIRSWSMDAQPSKGARSSVLVSSFSGPVLPE